MYPGSALGVFMFLMLPYKCFLTQSTYCWICLPIFAALRWWWYALRVYSLSELSIWGQLPCHLPIVPDDTQWLYSALFLTGCPIVFTLMCFSFALSHLQFQVKLGKKVSKDVAIEQLHHKASENLFGSFVAG